MVQCGIGLSSMQDEDEFPDLATGGTLQRNKTEQVQLKLPKPLVSVYRFASQTCLRSVGRYSLLMVHGFDLVLVSGVTA